MARTAASECTAGAKGVSSADSRWQAKLLWCQRVVLSSVAAAVSPILVTRVLRRGNETRVAMLRRRNIGCLVARAD